MMITNDVIGSTFGTILERTKEKRNIKTTDRPIKIRFDYDVFYNSYGYIPSVESFMYLNFVVSYDSS